MKYIDPGYEIIHCPNDALKRIEIAARTCYKSEFQIGPGSDEQIVRRLLRKNHYAMIEFGGALHVKFTSNRAFSHQIVRHRIASFAQESARWCNYSKQRFGRVVQNISPDSMRAHIKNKEAIDVYLDSTEQCFTFCEKHYFKMVEAGVPTQLAREALNIGLKTEINVMANLREWIHIFRERCSKQASPRMRELLIPLLLDIRDRIPVVFEDVLEEVQINE